MALLTLLTAAATMAPPTQTLLMAVAAMTLVMAVTTTPLIALLAATATEHVTTLLSMMPADHHGNHLRGTPLNGPLNDWPRHASELLLNLPEA